MYPIIHLVMVSVLAATLVPTSGSASDERRGGTPAPHAGDFAGLVDIGGGRHLYLECHGAGDPTVILEAGYRTSGRYWTDDLLHPEAPRTMVLPGVAQFTRVCAYDRPGTYASVGADDFVSRSDPVAQPRAAPEAAADLHALLQAAHVPGPYVLAGHSLGGFFARLYAATYPDEVVGMVLVDAYSEMLEDVMPPERWAALVRLNQGMGSDVVFPIPGYGDAETIAFGGDNAVMRAATAANPLRPMPLAVLAHGKAFPQSDTAPGFAPGELEGFMRAANVDKVALVPNARFTLAAESGHDIHQDQPELVIEAIRQVVAGVRNPDTWYDLTSCCATRSTASAVRRERPRRQRRIQLDQPHLVIDAIRDGAARRRRKGRPSGGQSAGRRERAVAPTRASAQPGGTRRMAFAGQISDHSASPDAGRIVESGRPEQIFRQSQQERTRQFLERMLSTAP
ncbi:MAG TPA: alpha/beta fold hydrolase [Thermomicrobiales bacterium]|nr:alpha/beta fold hydrolase [Thermomicrobiales bacterium]